MNKKEVKHFLDHVEIVIDKIIPPLVVLLLGVIIIEFFFEEIAHHYHTEIVLADGVIIGVFVIDLVFKYFHVKNIPRFLKHFWLDILAVFPFFLLFQAFEGVAAIFHIGETTERAQKLLHEGLELEKEGSKIVQEIEKAGKIRRATLFGRTQKFVRPVTRIPRILKIIPHQARKRVKKHHVKKFHARTKKIKAK